MYAIVCKLQLLYMIPVHMNCHKVSNILLSFRARTLVCMHITYTFKIGKLEKPLFSDTSMYMFFLNNNSLRVRATNK